MFKKYASILIQDISDECMLKSFASSDKEVAEIYRNISAKLARINKILEVEKRSPSAISPDD